MPETQEQQTKEAASAAAAAGNGPPPEEITRAVEAAKAAARFQDAADALKREAALAWDPAQREKLWTAAYAKEKEAHGESKKARRESIHRSNPHHYTHHVVSRYRTHIHTYPTPPPNTHGKG